MTEEPKPYQSWILDQEGRWYAPVEHPNDGGFYIWNEDSQSWDTSE